MELNFELTFNIVQLLMLEKESGKDRGSKEIVLNLLLDKEGNMVDFKVSSRNSKKAVNELAILARDMAEHIEEYSRDILKSKLRGILIDNKQEYHIAMTFCNTKHDEKTIDETVESLLSSVRRKAYEVGIASIISRASYDLRSKDADTTVNMLLENIQEYDTKFSIGGRKGVIEHFSLAEDEKMQAVLDNAGMEDTGATIFKTHWKAMNKMLQGGFRRKHLIMIGAMSHNYKSGLMYNLFLQFIFNNEPKVEEGKKPLILYFSCEDNPEQYMPIIYTHLYYHKYKTPPDIDYSKGKTYDAKFIRDEVKSRPWHTEVFRIDPNKWTIDMVEQAIKKYKQNGYDVQVVFFDYLSKLNSSGVRTDGIMGKEVYYLFDRMKGIASEHDICVITPHQISTAAKDVTRSDKYNPIDFLKALPGNAYTAGSRQLEQIIDVEIYIHKIKIAQDRYGLGVILGKQRLQRVTKDSNRLFVLPFPKGMGPILSDELNEELGFEVEMQDIIDNNF